MSFDALLEDSTFDPGFYDEMLRDEARNGAFRRAIEAVVRPGMVVADIGTGFGVLALFAARAGARKVHAIDRKPWLAPIVRALADANGYGDVIEVLIAEATTVRLPTPVDVVVSETLGNAGVDEGIQAIVDGFARHNLKPGGVVIPARVRCLAAPFAWNATVEALRSPSLSDFDLTPLPHLPARDAARITGMPVADPPLAAPAVLEEVRPGALAPLAPDPLTASFTIERPGILRTVVLWFEADLAPDHQPGEPPLHNGPGVARSSWLRRIQPAPRPVPVAAGDRLKLTVDTGGRGNCIGWSVRWTIDGTAV